MTDKSAKLIAESDKLAAEVKGIVESKING